MPSSSAEQRGDDVAALLARLAPRLSSAQAVLLIDGRSGSGKTTLAASIAPRLQARVLHLEDVYPDWTGLEAASLLLADRLLPAFRAGRPLGWRSWDWAGGRSGEMRWLLPGGRLIVEGCGALTAASRRLADAGVFLDVDEGIRRRRILHRDPPESLAGHAVWAASERRFAALHPPLLHADVVLRGGLRSRPGPLDTVGP